MIPRLLIILVVLFACSACGDSPKLQQVTDKGAGVPDALKEDEGSSGDVIRFSKRGKDDLTEVLYKELVGKTPELQRFEESYSQFKEAVNDSTVSFKNYNSRSDDYYYSAEELLGSMKDSILKMRLDKLIKQSRGRYKNKVSEFNNLIDGAEQDAISIDNYRDALKIVATLLGIEHYQQSALPGIDKIRKMATQGKNLKAKSAVLTQQYAQKAGEK